MSASGPTRKDPGAAWVDLERALANWRDALAESGEADVVSRHTTNRLRDLVEQALEHDGPVPLASLRAEVYRLAVSLGNHLARETMLRCLRDGLALALADVVQRSP